MTVFLWGITNVLTNPSGLILLSLIVGYVASTDNPSLLQAFKTSTAFCSGIFLDLLMILTLGGYTKYLGLIPAATFIIMGLEIIGIIRVRFPVIKGAFLIGILSGLSLGANNVKPALSLSISDVMIILSYVVGYCVVLLIAGTWSQIFSFYLWSEDDGILKGLAKGVSVLCGAVVIFGGIMQGLRIFLS